MDTGLNSPKKIIENQIYEEYWKSTLALTNFNGEQFRRTLQIVIEHIDKYKLYSYKSEDLILDLTKDNKHFNQEISHAKELEKLVFKIFPNRSKDGSSTRKQINTLVKLGFIKPYLNGYVPAAKEYIKSNIDKDERKRIFSDIVYQYASFNSSQTTDDTQNNQIKFIVNTLLNKSDKKLTMDEFIGLMQMDIGKMSYATDKDILHNKNWAEHINFYDRKYNQVDHLKLTLQKMNLFKVGNTGKKVGEKNRNEFFICLIDNASEFIPEKGNTKRDSYRFANMRKAVIEETIKIYGEKVSWFSKEKSEGMVVSHIYESAIALENYDLDSAYDPNNALYLKPGNEDQYFDKHKMTFNSDGIPIFSKQVDDSFIQKCREKSFRIDKKLLNQERANYILNYHNIKFKENNKCD